MYKVKYHKRVVKFLETKPDKVRRRIIEVFDVVKRDPFANLKNFDIKPLKGFENFYRLRIGKFRIIFKIDKSELLILVISAASRGDIYK